MNNRYTNKNVVITGAAGGMGFEMVRRFGNEGANVVILDINQSLLDQAVQTLCDEGLTVTAFAVDVTDTHAVARVFSDIAKNFIERC
ncbi:MAG: SDR family NAD(P)-dependent oxidoreductase [Methylococcales bacterium]|nr:SDR family NAD(P)-dependent oxidoreductase [Methylococcales bacterium]